MERRGPREVGKVAGGGVSASRGGHEPFLSVGPTPGGSSAVPAIEGRIAAPAAGDDMPVLPATRGSVKELRGALSTFLRAIVASGVIAFPSLRGW